jgi:hypothetical protein
LSISWGTSSLAGDTIFSPVSGADADLRERMGVFSFLLFH